MTAICIFLLYIKLLFYGHSVRTFFFVWSPETIEDLECGENPGLRFHASRVLCSKISEACINLVRLVSYCQR